MRTEKRNAFLSGLCGFAVALGVMAGTALADVTTERGASILAFPKVLANSEDGDTLIQITNISNNMVHAHCFYVNAAPDFFGNPQWQVTDFSIWLTKQQPTHWVVSTGRFVNPTDTCASSAGRYTPSAACASAGIDPGAIPPVVDFFVGELKCIEVDVAGNPIGGNHLKGEATLISADNDISKYNALGIQGTDLAGETGNELLLNQPHDSEEQVGQYNSCPNVLLLNHLSEGVTDPVLYANLLGGTCTMPLNTPCYSDADCEGGVCQNPPQILDGANQIDLISATLTDLTLIPCSEDFENAIPASVTVQFVIYNEFEEQFSASITVDCWKNFYLFEVDSPNDPMRSVFSFNVLGTVAAHTRIIPNPGDGAVLGVAGVTRADSQGNLTRAALNIHMEGDRFTASGGEVVDKVTIPDFSF